MGRTGKWIFGTVAGLLGLLLLITLSLPLLIDPNDYKEVIARQVREQTGRQVSIPGDIVLQVSPLGLKTVFRLGEVHLSATSDSPDTELLTSRLAEIQLALWPLIRSKELQINTIRLEGVSLNLIRGEDGKGNWGQPPVAEGKTAPAPTRQPTATPLAAIDIGGVEIKDLNVSYTDRQAGTSARLDKFNLTIGRVRPASPIPVQGDFSLLLDDKGRQPLSARVSAQTTVIYNPDRQVIQIQGFTGSAQVGGGTLPLPELGLDLTCDLDLDLRQEKVEVKKFILAKGEVRLEGTVTLTGQGAPRATGTLRLPPFSPRAQAAAWGLSLPLANPESLNKLAAEIDFSSEPATLTVSRLQLNLDDATVTGTATVRNLDSQPAYDLNLHADRLDLNRYAASQQASPAAPPPQGATPEALATGGDEPLLPVVLLRGLDFNADLRVDSLQTGKLSLSNLQLKARGSGDLLTIAPLTAGLYGGSATLQGEIDARQDLPRIRLTESVKGIDLGPLLRDLTGKEDVTGRADSSGEVTSQGRSKNELTRNSNGTLKLAVADGEIAKLQILDTIRAANTLFGAASGKSSGTAATPATKQTAAGEQGAGRPTSFTRLTASGVLQNGVLRNDDLLGESELMRVTGKGSVDLVNEQLDYLLTVILTKALDRTGQTGLANLTETPIPYRVRGSFDRIEQSAALEEIVKAGAQQMLMKEVEKRLGGDKPAGTQQGSDTQDLLNKGLKSLFGK